MQHDAQCCDEIKSLLLNSSTGLTEEELYEAAKLNGVDQPEPIVASFIEVEGLARRDLGKNGRPTRIKATNKLFDEEAT